MVFSSTDGYALVSHPGSETRDPNPSPRCVRRSPTLCRDFSGNGWKEKKKKRSDLNKTKQSKTQSNLIQSCPVALAYFHCVHYIRQLQTNPEQRKSVSLIYSMSRKAKETLARPYKIFLGFYQTGFETQNP